MKLARKSRRKPPLEVWDENVRLKICIGKNKVNCTVPLQFTLIYYDGVKRCKRRFADLAGAKKKPIKLGICTKRK